MSQWMKLLISSLMIGFALMGSNTVQAKAPAVIVNGIQKNDSITINGKTLIKLRALTDPEWLVFAYDPKTRVAMFHTKDDKIYVYLREGDKTATVNGKKVAVGATVVNKNGLTYVPLRFISETLGAYVKYEKDNNRVIVRTPNYQAKFMTLMKGDLTEARKIALDLPQKSSAPPVEFGEGYHSTMYTFPEGEALRFIINTAGYQEYYYEVDEQGFAIRKWQFDHVGNREWGTKPVFERAYYFDSLFMSDWYYYGTVDSNGKQEEYGSFRTNKGSKLIVPIEGEVRKDARN
ncbi:copper amine oxidase N-terminal domain-containing protein [Paenibacillus pasadenensis]|uniref:copper amine oxidase N-terminal domain-containing protein n=1 Tax=Paenibacillus pasadenensis TaxID=217090 RepID=UPI00203CEE8D|nr:copper amine oxidase N-terminal domain-containing protein [Paenibacillus pasadenensis]MCM3749822.1 copper amine oxidase N-terminal domain-containing protein [Paenibacillus pasadenensis]